MRIFLIVLSSIIILVTGCKEPVKKSTKDIKTLYQGETMGTYYRVTYLDHRNFKPQIEGVLVEVNNQMSTYLPKSIISQVNQTNGMYVGSKRALRHFIPVFESAKTIYKTTDGSFDPTVMPLVNYWGFGYTEKKVRAANQLEIDSLRQLIDFDGFDLKVIDQAVKINKKNGKAQLDFSAIAKGYAVDQIALLLDSKNINNYLVDIGGEVRAKGKNERGSWWTIGINTPKSEAKTTDLQQLISLNNKSIASSGNYRNFYEKEGVKYGHTINPKSGMPELNNLLSASIIADDCMTADAYATAAMVMGLEEAFEMVAANPKLEGYFIYGSDEGTIEVKYTSAMEPLLLK